MDSGHQSFDPTGDIIHSFVSSNLSRIEADFRHVRRQLLAEVFRLKPKGLKPSKVLPILDASANAAEELLREICSHHSIDWWLVAVRRLPVEVAGWPDAWIAFATIAILKHSSWEDTTQGSIRTDRQHGVVFDATESDMLLACRLAGAARILAETTNLIRWLGKGATVRHLGDGRLKNRARNDVREAVEAYERRRPENALFADAGIFVGERARSVEEYSRTPIVALGRPNPPFARLLPSRDAFKLSYFPRLLDPKRVRAGLIPYDEAIYDIFRIRIEQVASVLASIGRLMLRSIPEGHHPNPLLFNSETEDFAHRFRFMLRLCRKGFVRFPREYLRERIVAAHSTLGHSTSPSDAESDVDAFFEAFCLVDQDRRKLEVRTLKWLPLLCQSPSGHCYLDMLWMEDFLRNLVVRGKQWFSSEHGDRFTIRLKKHLEEKVRGIQVLGWKTKSIDGENEHPEVDLAVHHQGRLYCIECKAYAKNDAFWRGERKAVSDRAARIAKAVRQARAAGEAIKTLLAEGRLRVPGVRVVEWVVCMPSQEFLKPLSKFGLLETGVPRVCTPQELILHLRRLSENAGSVTGGT